MGLAPASVMANARVNLAGESTRAAGKLQRRAARQRRERLMALHGIKIRSLRFRVP